MLSITTGNVYVCVFVCVCVCVCVCMCVCVRVREKDTGTQTFIIRSMRHHLQCNASSVKLERSVYFWFHRENESRKKAWQLKRSRKILAPNAKKIYEHKHFKNYIFVYLLETYSHCSSLWGLEKMPFKIYNFLNVPYSKQQRQSEWQKHQITQLSKSVTQRIGHTVLF